MALRVRGPVRPGPLGMLALAAGIVVLVVLAGAIMLVVAAVLLVAAAPTVALRRLPGRRKAPRGSAPAPQRAAAPGRPDILEAEVVGESGVRAADAPAREETR